MNAAMRQAAGSASFHCAPIQQATSALATMATYSETARLATRAICQSRPLQKPMTAPMASTIRMIMSSQCIQTPRTKPRLTR